MEGSERTDTYVNRASTITAASLTTLSRKVLRRCGWTQAWVG
jgi:hypothetical protein